jgi:pimeloyl-ACP methyl ester carboxylesterase
MDIRRIEVTGPGEGRYGMAYAAWGVPDAPKTLICVHGLTRNGRDFDHLAGVLADDMQVLCPDVVGRGLSDPLIDPNAYALPTYVQHMMQFIQALGLEEVDWLGTSMGGLIGMGIAAHGAASPIRRLILNDVGPFIPKASLERINGYLGQNYRFERLDLLEQHLRITHAGFGPLGDAEWRHLAEHSAARREDGRFGLNYDQRIGDTARAGGAADIDLWPVYEAIRCPVLVLRGAESDLLTAEVADEMTRRGPKTELVSIDETGHAPMLMAADEIEVVRSWLRQESDTAQASAGKAPEPSAG